MQAKLKVGTYLSKGLCGLVSAALLITQLDGCAQAAKDHRASLLSMEGSDIPTRSFGLPESRPPMEGEVLFFGRVQVIEVDSGNAPDLSCNAALFLTAEDAPDKPLPLWPSSAFKRASIPYSPDKDGHFAIIAPPGKYGLQLIYRSPKIGWIAVDASVHTLAQGASGAIYLGDLQIRIEPGVDPQKISVRASPLTVRISVFDDFAPDYNHLQAEHVSLGTLPVESRLLYPRGTPPTVILGTNRSAESLVRSDDSVSKVARTLAVIALFAAYVVVTAAQVAVVAGSHVR